MWSSGGGGEQMGDGGLDGSAVAGEGCLAGGADGLGFFGVVEEGDELVLKVGPIGALDGSTGVEEEVDEGAEVFHVRAK